MIGFVNSNLTVSIVALTMSPSQRHIYHCMNNSSIKIVFHFDTIVTWKKPLDIYKFPSIKKVKIWSRHWTLQLPLSIQVYQWVPANLMLGPVTLAWTSNPSQRGVEILLIASYYRKQENLKPGGPFGSYKDLPYYIYFKYNFRAEQRVSSK